MGGRRTTTWWTMSTGYRVLSNEPLGVSERCVLERAEIPDEPMSARG